MINKEEYIKDLLLKKLMGVISKEDAAILEVSKMIYTEEEFDMMLADVLLNMDPDYIKSQTKGWKPDIPAIIAAGDKARAEKKAKLLRKRVSWAAGIFIPFFSLLAFLYYYTYKNKEIPLSESNFMLSVNGSDYTYISKEWSGQLSKQGNVSITKEESGLLKLKLIPELTTNLRTETGLTIWTKAQQQCVVELPDGTRVRLRAQSFFVYRTLLTGESLIQLAGDAYIRRKDSKTNQPLFIGTENGEVTVDEGEFLIQAQANYTSASVLKGKLNLQSKQLKESVSLDAGSKSELIRNNTRESFRAKDVFITTRENDFERAMMWTRANRTYKGISLREFVEEMGRWYGFRVIGDGCIPKQAVNVSIAYQQTFEDFKKIIGHMDLRVYDVKGMLSFCPDKKEELKNLNMH